jgi:hypothetical protein
LIGILEALENAAPSEPASAIGPTQIHRAMLTKRVHIARVPRRSVIIDRRFVSAFLRQRRASMNSAVLPNKSERTGSTTATKILTP